MVVEDVDLIALIAREREHMRHALEEVLLNNPLNEMDGLSEDSEGRGDVSRILDAFHLTV